MSILMLTVLHIAAVKITPLDTSKTVKILFCKMLTPFIFKLAGHNKTNR